MVTTLGFVRLSDINDTAQVAAPFDDRLVAYGCEAAAGTSSNDDSSLTLACLAALAPKLDDLRRLNYRPWLFLAGAAMSRERRASFPQYSLSNPARRHNLVCDPDLEQDFLHGEKVRRAGLYGSRWDRFNMACQFSTTTSWGLFILSSRRDFLDLPGFDKLYVAAGLNEDGTVHDKVNWLAAGALLCPMGDVVVKTDGPFNKRIRSVNLVFGTKTAVAPVTRNSQMPSADEFGIRNDLKKDVEPGPRDNIRMALHGDVWAEDLDGCWA